MVLVCLFINVDSEQAIQPAIRLVAIDLTALPKAVTKDRIRVIAAEVSPFSKSIK